MHSERSKPYLHWPTFCSGCQPPWQWHSCWAFGIAEGVVSEQESKYSKGRNAGRGSPPARVYPACSAWPCAFSRRTCPATSRGSTSQAPSTNLEDPCIGRLGLGRKPQTRFPPSFLLMRALSVDALRTPFRKIPLPFKQ